MTTPVATGYPSDTARSHGDMRQVMENILALCKETRGGNAPSSVTLSGDAFTPANNYSSFELSAESGVADDLANISPLNTPNGRHIILRAASGHSITLKHNAVGTGKMSLYGAVDKVISGDMAVELRYDSATTTYYEHDRNIFSLFPSSAANLFMASPSGSSGFPSLRSIAAADLDAGNIMSQILGWLAASSVTLSSDAFAPSATTSACVVLTSQTGSSDDLKFIDCSAWPAGRIMKIRPASGHTIKVWNSASSPPANHLQIVTARGTDTFLAGNMTMELIRIGSTIYEVSTVRPSIQGMGGTIVDLALSTDSITPTASTGHIISVAAETGTSDNLKWIDDTNMMDFQFFRLRARSGDTITVKHLGGAGTGNQRQISTTSGTDVVLSGNKTMLVYKDGTSIKEAGVSSGGYGVTQYTLSGDVTLTTGGTWYDVIDFGTQSGVIAVDALCEITGSAVGNNYELRLIHAGSTILAGTSIDSTANTHLKQIGLKYKGSIASGSLKLQAMCASTGGVVKQNSASGYTSTTAWLWQ